ncbi:MAG: glycosyltransferase family 4 protein [Roseburia sp.]|nr:glycosyltransferase family 4 protein [Roseburia sp.]
MKRKGFQVTVVIPNNAEGHHAAEYDRICSEYRLTTCVARYSIAVCMEDINIAAALEEYPPLVRLLEVQQPDLIHSTQLNIAVELAARELQIPHLMNIYQTDRQSFQMKWMNIYPQYHSADSLLFSQCWGGGLGITSRCVRVAYKEKNPKGGLPVPAHEEISIVSIGVLCERKQQLEVIRFVLTCRNEGYPVRLVILGDDDNTYGDRCRAFVTENGLSEAVTFAGFVTDVEKYLKAADLLIQASTEESYPGVIVESMANQVPVLSTPVAGVPELLEDGKNGFLSAGYEVDDFYHAFLKYMEYRKTGRLSAVVERAYQTYQNNHSYAAVAEQLGQYYDWIMRDYSEKKDRVSYLKAEDVKERLNEFVGDSRPGQVNDALGNRIWFFYHVCMSLREKEKQELLIWGAGYWGSRVLEWLQMFGMGGMLRGFIDTRKQGEYLGYPVVRKEDPAVAECGTILIAVADKKSELEIIEELEKCGKVRSRDYFRMCNHFIL